MQETCPRSRGAITGITLLFPRDSRLRPKDLVADRLVHSAPSVLAPPAYAYARLLLASADNDADDSDEEFQIGGLPDDVLGLDNRLEVLAIHRFVLD